MDKSQKKEKEVEFFISPEEYKREAIKTIKKIKSPEILKLIYYFAKSGYKEENAGRR